MCSSKVFAPDSILHFFSVHRPDHLRAFSQFYFEGTWPEAFLKEAAAYGFEPKSHILPFLTDKIVREFLVSKNIRVPK